MNMPEVIAFITSFCAISFSCCGSPAVPITKSTGKSPPPGSAGGVSGIARMPGIFESGPNDSINNCCAVLCRSLHGFGNRLVDVENLRPEEFGLFDRLVRRGLHNREHDTLILGRRQLLLREQIGRAHV